MTWMLYKVAADETLPVIDNSSAAVVCNIDSLNTGKVKCSGTAPIDTDTEVIIQDYVVDTSTGAMSEIHDILHGVVMKYTELTKGTTTNTYEYDISEMAATLDYYRVHTTDATPSYTVNIAGSTTILAAVNICLRNLEWTVGAKHDGSSDTIGSAIQLIDMKVIKGIYKFVKELGATDMDAPSYLWFDSDAKTIQWGSYRTDRRAAIDFKKGVYYGKEQYKTIKFQVPGVKVYGSGKTYVGQYPPVFTSPKFALYQIDDATSNEECLKYATRIYNDYTVDAKERIQFKLRPNQTKPGGTYILEGDLIRIDSETITNDVNGKPTSGYVITDMTYSPKEVQVGTITTMQTIFGQLGDRLRVIEGGTGGPVNQNWGGATQIVGGT